MASTVAYVLLYLLLRSVLAAQAANAISLLLTAVANTAVNRRVTFGIRGRAHAARHQVRGLIAFAIGLALTSGALAALHASAPQAGRTAELTVLVAANLTSTLVRFALYRSWVFRHGAARARKVASGERHLHAAPPGPPGTRSRRAGAAGAAGCCGAGPATQPGPGLRCSACCWPRPCSTWRA